MAGFDLKEGQYIEKEVVDDELWKSFSLVFSTNTVNSSSYKFVFLKSILDCINSVDDRLTLTFDQIFERFTEIYWSLVVNYGVRQGNSSVHETHVEQILHEYIGGSENNVVISIFGLSDRAKKKIVKKIKNKCKKYVIGALYEDTKQLFYSFSKKNESLAINPCMYLFLQKHQNAIQELNYYEFAKFMEKVNAVSTAQKICSELALTNENDYVAVYRKLLAQEFEKVSCYVKNNEVNTLEMLYVAEESYYKADIVDMENNRVLLQEKCEENMSDDTTSMMLYLGDPERIIKMLKLRKGIY